MGPSAMDNNRYLSSFQGIRGTIQAWPTHDPRAQTPARHLRRSLDPAALNNSPGSMGYRWILFDADNTLFDFDRSAHEALQRTIEAHGVAFEPAHATTYQQINTRYWHAFERGEVEQSRLRVGRFEELLKNLGLTATDPATFATHYEQRLSEGGHLLDGSEEILEILRPHVQMALITNGLQSVQRPRLAKSPIRPYFREILISEEVGAAKPDPQIFEVAFSRMGSPTPAEVLMVGDSLSSDIRGGADFGCDTCWYNPHQNPLGSDVSPTFEIEHLRQLEAICISR